MWGLYTSVGRILRAEQVCTQLVPNVSKAQTAFNAVHVLSMIGQQTKSPAPVGYMNSGSFSKTIPPCKCNIFECSFNFEGHRFLPNNLRRL